MIVRSLAVRSASRWANHARSSPVQSADAARIASTARPSSFTHLVKRSLNTSMASLTVVVVPSGMTICCVCDMPVWRQMYVRRNATRSSRRFQPASAAARLKPFGLPLSRRSAVVSPGFSVLWSW